MNRREELMKDVEKWEETIFADSIRKLEHKYGKPQQRNAVVQSFAELFQKWEETCKAASLGICYLHRNILMKTGELRLTLYGEEFYLDRHQVEAAWHLPDFFEQYENDMNTLIDKIRKEYPRVYLYEIDAVRFHYAEYYYAAIAAMCRDLLEEITDCEEFKALNKTADFFFFFGRWRGEAQKL